MGSAKRETSMKKKRVRGCTFPELGLTAHEEHSNLQTPEASMEPQQHNRAAEVVAALAGEWHRCGHPAGEGNRLGAILERGGLSSELRLTDGSIWWLPAEFRPREGALVAAGRMGLGPAAWPETSPNFRGNKGPGSLRSSTSLR